MNKLDHVLNTAGLLHDAIGHGDRTLYGEFPQSEPKKVYWPHLNVGANEETILQMCRNTGKPLTSQQFIEDYVDAVENDILDRRRRGEVEPDVPVFTWTELYPSSFHFRIHGYYAEARPRISEWYDSFALRYYGYGATRLWDHRELLGLGVHENEFRPGFDRRRVLNVVVPARRYAGLHAYELQELHYLAQPKPGDWSRELFQHETEGRYVRHRDGYVMYLDDFPPGATTITYTKLGSGFRMVNPYEEHASARRARHSSTMDKNGKPRRK